MAHFTLFHKQSLLFEILMPFFFGIGVSAMTTALCLRQYYQGPILDYSSLFYPLHIFMAFSNALILSKIFRALLSTKGNLFKSLTFSVFGSVLFFIFLSHVASTFSNTYANYQDFGAFSDSLKEKIFFGGDLILTGFLISVLFIEMAFKEDALTVPSYITSTTCILMSVGSFVFSALYFYFIYPFFEGGGAPLIKFNYLGSPLNFIPVRIPLLFFLQIIPTLSFWTGVFISTKEEKIQKILCLICAIILTYGFIP